MDKQIAYYTPNEYEQIHLGRSAIIFNVLNHPALGNKNYVITTEVLSKKENREFETLNTIYKPIK